MESEDHSCNEQQLDNITEKSDDALSGGTDSDTFNDKNANKVKVIIKKKRNGEDNMAVTVSNILNPKRRRRSKTNFPDYWEIYPCSKYYLNFYSLFFFC